MGAYETGEPWGPEGPRLAQALRRQATPDQADRIGQMLARENRLSVDHRYGESGLEDIYNFRGSRTPVAVDPVIILKAIACYEYQSCEHPGWEGSEAHAFCEALRHRMIRRLPGYDQAPWEIESREQYVRPTNSGEDESC